MSGGVPAGGEGGASWEEGEEDEGEEASHG